MNVKVAKTAGFCFGVERAVNKVYELIEQGKGPIYTLGPIIHNESVVSDLEEKGVQVIEEKDLDSLKSGIVVIRSHGVGRAVYDKLETLGISYVDVTCPFVLKIHRIVQKESSAGSLMWMLPVLLFSKYTGSCRKKAVPVPILSLLGTRIIRRCRESAGGARGPVQW